jgi:trans-2,3-dihydro-3-hydroxyanthranilate isomerase
MATAETFWRSIDRFLPTTATAEGDGHHTVMLRQGREMGRPSLIEVQFNTEQGQLRHAGIGGSAVVLAEGVIDLDE